MTQIRILLFCLLALNPIVYLYGQNRIELRAASDSSVIEYANLFSAHSVVGYVSYGELTLFERPADNRMISLHALGYDTLMIQFPLTHDTILWLNRKRLQLQPVVVSAGKCVDTFNVGATKGRLQKRIGSSLSIIYQDALKIRYEDIGKSDCWIRKARIYMPKTKEQQCGTLRLRIYDERADTSMPGADILNTDYTISVVNDGKWYEVDVSKEGIPITGNVFVGFEAIPTTNCDTPSTGVMVQKGGVYLSYVYHAEKRTWFQLKVDEDWKRMPNLAAQVQIGCPCERSKEGNK